MGAYGDQLVRDQRVISPEKLEAIRQAVITLFSQRGFAEVGIRDICREAGITPNTIYKYFGNKDRLLIAAIQPDFERMNERMAQAAEGEGTVPERLNAASREYFRFYLENRPLARIVFLCIPSSYFSTDPDFVQRRTQGIQKELVRQGQEEGLIRDDVSAMELVEAMAAVAMRRMYKLLTRQQADCDPQQEADKLANLLGPMLGADAGSQAWRRQVRR